MELLQKDSSCVLTFAFPPGLRLATQISSVAQLTPPVLVQLVLFWPNILPIDSALLLLELRPHVIANPFLIIPILGLPMVACIGNGIVIRNYVAARLCQHSPVIAT